MQLTLDAQSLSTHCVPCMRSQDSPALTEHLELSSFAVILDTKSRAAFQPASKG